MIPIMAMMMSSMAMMNSMTHKTTIIRRAISKTISTMKGPSKIRKTTMVRDPHDGLISMISMMSMVEAMGVIVIVE